MSDVQTDTPVYRTVNEWHSELDAWVRRLDARLPVNHVPIEIDVLFDSGGFRGYYTCPIVYFLQHSRRYRVMRVAGASAGAAAACGIVCDIDIPTYITMFHTRYQPEVLVHGRAILDVLDDIVRELFPANAHILCEDRVFISVHEILPLSFSKGGWSRGGLEHQAISSFPSFSDLVQVMKCSMTVSKITTTKNAQMYNGRSYLDGLKPLLPADESAHGRPQLFVDLHRLPYPGKWMMSPQDPNIDRLVKQCMSDFEQFIAVEDNNNHTRQSTCSDNYETNKLPIYWIDSDDDVTQTTDNNADRASGVSIMNIHNQTDTPSALPRQRTASASAESIATQRSQASNARLNASTINASHEMQRSQQRMLRTVHIIGSTWDRVRAARDRFIRESHVLRELLSPSTSSLFASSAPTTSSTSAVEH